MDGHDIHHLPVTKNRTLIAVLNSHDLKAYSGSDEANIRQLRLKKAYIVDLSVPADQVLMTMADKHLSVALVTRKEKLVGLFTGTDALRAFAEHLRPDISTGGDSAA